MVDLIAVDPPYLFYDDGEESLPSDDTLLTIMNLIRGLDRFLDENQMGLRTKKQAQGMLADLFRLLKENLDDLNLQEGETLPPDIVTELRDLINVTADRMQGVVIGDGSITAGIIGDIIIYINGNEPNGDSSGSAAVGSSRVERAYLRWLVNQYSQIQLSKLNTRLSQQLDKPEISLNEIFVQLDIQHTAGSVGGDEPDGRAPVPVLDAINRRNVTVVLGDPGSGKTTLLNFLTIYLALARLDPDDERHLAHLSLPQRNGRAAVNWKHGALLPIRVTLRDFVKGLPDDPEDIEGSAKLLMSHITEQLGRHNFEKFEEDVRAALLDGKCLVMLDGLDEVGTEYREIVRDTIKDFIDGNEGNRFIMTCRKLSYTNPDWQLHYPPVILAPLLDDTIKEFIDLWYEALAERGIRSMASARDKACELKEAIVEFDDDFIRNPMLLTVVCILHNYQLELSRERARLYQDCIELLMWKWTEPRLTAHNGWEEGITKRLGVDDGHLINGLCELAYTLHREQDANNASSASISRSRVLDVLSTHLGNDREKAEQFCDYVEQQAGLLVGQGQPTGGEPMYAFLHRGFQEFLAAWHVISDWDFTHLVAELAHKSDMWHEVLLLAIGHMVFNNKEYKRPLAAVNVLVPDQPPTDERGWQPVWWAGEMLSIIGRSYAENDELVGRQVVPRLISQLTWLVSEGHLTPVERAKAADALGRLGDPRPGVCTLEPEMIRIEGGPFTMGAGRESHNITLSPFYIAKYTVTNAQFRMFLNDGEGGENGYFNDIYWTPAGLAWRSTASSYGGYVDDPVWGIDNRPVVGISWYEAIAYVRWLRHRTHKRYRLLTEAEWERAAAGTEGRLYACGSKASDNDVNTRETGIGQTTSAGIFPKDCTPEGICDLSGNIWEWTASLDRDYPYKPDGSRERLDSPGGRVVRGGAFERPRSEMRARERRCFDPRARTYLLGVRLAKDAR